VICYNRPEHLRKLLDRLQRDDIQNLYLFSDAAQTEKDRSKVEEVRKLIRGIKWTRPTIVESTVNLGCARMIPYAVTTTFEQNERAIFLEDDCIPKDFFFQYMERCLDKYEYHSNIFGIAAYSVPIPENMRKIYPYDIYFFPRICSEGWGSWKGAWECYDPDLKSLYEQCLDNNIDLNQGGNNIPPGVRNKIVHPEWNVWTLNWVLTVYLNRAQFIYPIVSQTKNIGNDGSGVHTNIHHTDTFPVSDEEMDLVRLPEDIVTYPDIYNFLWQKFSV